VRKIGLSGGSISPIRKEFVWYSENTGNLPMTDKGKRVAIYARTSTEDQTTENQLAELRRWAERAGHTVAVTFQDPGISGAKGRDKRPEFDALLKGAVRREFDMIAVWSSDRLGRSLTHLIDVLETIKGTGVGLYIHTQALDTTTPAGRAMFQMLGVFAEFEREMIRSRVHAGMARVKCEIDKHGRYETKKGTVIMRFGRPGAEPHKIEEARKLLAAGNGILKVAKTVGIGTSTVQKLANEMRA
jgi:DNA invertase Pin-like site-specific DNA recombinase